MFGKLFSLPIFLIALAVGLLFVYLNEPQGDIIYVYPTPDNVDEIEYKDRAGNCFEFSANKIECLVDKDKIKHIPVQESAPDPSKNSGILGILNNPT
jgi:hypothetical protein